MRERMRETMAQRRGSGLHPIGDKQAPRHAKPVAGAGAGSDVRASRQGANLSRLTTSLHTTPNTRHTTHSATASATMGALLSLPLLALPSVGTVSTARSCRRRIANARSSGELPPHAVEQPHAAPSLALAVESAVTASRPELHTPSFSSSTRSFRGSCSPTGP